MGKATTETSCLTLPLKLEKWQADRLEKRLEIARQLYNTLLRFELKKLRRMEESEAYKEIMTRLKDQLDDAERGKLYQELDKQRKDTGFSEYAFKADIKRFYKHFSANIGSNVAYHGIAPQVWSAFARLFYLDGKTVHFKRYGDMKSVQGYSYSKKSGGKEIMFRFDSEKWKSYIEWNGLKLPVKLDPENDYERKMLQSRVKYCRILKKPGRRKTHWYVQLMLECIPAIKKDASGEALHPIGHGDVGIDIGPQTIAYVSDKEAKLMELADQVKNIEREKQILQRKLDRSRRATNPDNYAPDGTIKRGVKLTRNKSRRYLVTQRKLADLLRKQADTRKRQHNALANHLISLGDQFYIEDMAWPALTQRAKKTEISEKTGRYKRKKRFGKSVGNKAPAMLIAMLDLKLKSRGLPGVNRVPTTLKASQYNHMLDEYHKKDLSERWNQMPDGKRIQRDLYSAFLLQHLNAKKNGFDREALNQHYPEFVVLHDRCIQELREAPRTIASMGIVRRGN